MSAGRQPQGHRIQPADPRTRATAVRLAVAGILIAALLAAFLTTFENEIAAWVERHAMGPVERPGTITLLLFIVMLPMLALSAYVFREGARIVRAQRFPLPGQKVVRDTVVLEGRQAVRRGRAIQGIALTMAVISLAVPLLPQLFFTHFRL